MNIRVAPFEWSGGHPALDFVNTLDERSFDPPIENIATYRDFVRFAELARLIDRRQAADLRNRSGAACVRVVDGARELREHVYAVLSGLHGRQSVSQRALAAIASAIQKAHAARALSAAKSRNVALYRWTGQTDASIPLHACALAVEHLLTAVDRRRIKKCRASDCDVYFLDTSKAHRRHWCSMKNCGNREKQRRWRSATEGAPMRALNTKS